MLTLEDQKHLLSEFPDLKLSYENITHKKVYNSELVFAIPDGAKCFAWFSFFSDEPVCLLFELGPDKKPCLNIRRVCCSFNTDLAYGTIVYGTMIYHLNNPFFAIEDIFRYKGADVSRKNWGDKMVLFHSLLSNDLSRASYNRSFVVFGLPPFAKTFNEIVGQIKANNAYRISAIQFRLLGRSNNYLYMQWHHNPTFDKSVATGSTFLKCGARESTFEKGFSEARAKYPPFTKQEPNDEQLQFKKKTEQLQIKRSETTFGSTFTKCGKHAVFTVKPDLQNDIYHLYEDDDKYHAVALIPDYNTSVMMNKLFRNIKENANLDTLEESDDEDEFEDERDEQFVFLDKTYKMVCAYNYKFKKWAPLRLSV